MKRRISLIYSVFSYLFLSYPARLMRFVAHPMQWIPAISRRHLKSNSLREWISDFFFYFMDLLFMPEIFQLAMILVKPNLRHLSKREKSMAKLYFHNAILLDYVIVNSEMAKKMKKLAYAFVSYNIINYRKTISNPIFIHELVHIFQYQHLGSVYIPRALRAQRSVEGYDYGGIEKLYADMMKQRPFLDFNFEQQGEIFEDYCKLKESPVGINNHFIEATYLYYITQVRDISRSEQV